MDSFDKQRELNRKKEMSEGVFLGVVLLLLWSIYLYSGIWSSYEAQRYNHDIASYTPNIKNYSLGDLVCDPKNEKKKCLDTVTAYKKAKAQIYNIKKSLKMRQNELYKELIHIEKTKNETHVTHTLEALKYRKKTLSLDNNGESAAINKILNWIEEKEKKDQNITNGYMRAVIAVSDGDTAYPYSKEFTSNNGDDTLLNRSARFINKVYDANQNINKANLAKTILNPIGSLASLEFGLMILFTLWVIVTYILRKLSVRKTKPLEMLPDTMILWGILMVVSQSFVSWKAGVVMMFIGLVIKLLHSSTFFVQELMRSVKTNRWMISSRFAYPGFVWFVGFGLILLMDLSSRGFIDNRYLFITHASYVMYAFMLLSFMPIFLFVLSKIATKEFVRVAKNIFWPSSKKQRIIFVALLLLFTLLVLFVAKILPDSATSELMKFWFIITFAIFLTFNARSLDSNFWLDWKFMFSLWFAVVPSIGGLILAGEMGTTMVLLYSFAIFIGGFVSFNLTKHNGNRSKMTYGVLFALIIGVLFTIGIDSIGDLHARTAQRLLSWHSPFESNNEDMALIHWFRESAPFFGYGIGSIPWSGFSLDGYNGVPHQMQSDYIITSLVAAYGTFFAITMLGLYATWLLHSVKDIWLFGSSGVIGSEKHQHIEYVLLSWIGLVWIVVTVVQMLLSSAGNLGFMPLTGITFVFLSFGGSSLLAGTFFFSLVINRPFNDSTEETV